jgi:hypothetical protein
MDSMILERPKVKGGRQTSSCPLIETWKPSNPDLLAILPSHAQAAEAFAQRFRAPVRSMPSEIDSADVGSDSVSCIFAAPHTDGMHNPWFVMYVLRSYQHTVKAMRRQDRKDIMVEKLVKQIGMPEFIGRRKVESAVLTVGDIMILSAHNAHWLEGAPDMLPAEKWPWDQGNHAVEALIRPHVFVALATDIKERPTREQAERIILRSADMRLL